MMTVVIAARDHRTVLHIGPGHQGDGTVGVDMVGAVLASSSITKIRVSLAKGLCATFSTSRPTAVVIVGDLGLDSVHAVDGLVEIAV